MYFSIPGNWLIIFSKDKEVTYSLDCCPPALPVLCDDVYTSQRFFLDKKKIYIYLCILYQTTVISFIQDKFPKSQIDVYVTVIEDDGGLLAACITAAGLALCHASIDVYDLIVGSSVVSCCSDICSLINALVLHAE